MAESLKCSSKVLFPAGAKRVLGSDSSCARMMMT